MSDFPFRVIRNDEDADLGIDGWRERTSGFEAQSGADLGQDAPRYEVDDALETALNAAIAVRRPLILTGESGCGKTQAAYYLAWKVGQEGNRPFVFHVKSESRAQDLLWTFDSVRYFYESNLAARSETGPKPNRMDSVTRGPLWKAFEWANKNQAPAIVLIDEIDKAPRDFPNDLLHEIDQMEFEVSDLPDGHEFRKVQCDKRFRPVVIITSNEERALPAPFMRRCLYYNIEFSERRVIQAAMRHREFAYESLDPGFVELATECFFKVRDATIHKKPSTGELLIWLQILHFHHGSKGERLKSLFEVKNLRELPHILALVKDSEDLERLERA